MEGVSIGIAKYSNSLYTHSKNAVIYFFFDYHLAVRATRQAIYPLFAINILLNISKINKINKNNEN